MNIQTNIRIEVIEHLLNRVGFPRIQVEFSAKILRCHRADVCLVRFSSAIKIKCQTQVSPDPAQIQKTKRNHNEKLVGNLHTKIEIEI